MSEPAPSSSGENEPAPVRTHRVLPEAELATLDDYVKTGGGVGLQKSLELSADELIELVTASGLRGRGGGGFPTGVKWRTVADFASDELATTVVINGAEGEPGTFKDRAILRANPYAVLEGAVIAARAVGAPTAVIAIKSQFRRERQRIDAAIAEMVGAGLVDDGVLSVFEGPDAYLFGEETALLEALAGRPPFPRIAPPWRRGVDEAVRSVDDVDSGSGSAAPVEMAGSTPAPPTLVNNVETIANVAGIVANGADWFRSVGTADSPGTVVCTVSGSTVRAGVGEVPMGTTLGAAIEAIGGGVETGRAINAVLLGVANPVLTGDQLDTPLTYEAMAAAGSGLGSVGVIVLDDQVDPVAAAAGVSRFLAVESCGQCSPCKQDGLAIAAALRALLRSPGDEASRRDADSHLATVGDEARCALAAQHQQVVGGLLALHDRTAGADRRAGVGGEVGGDEETDQSVPLLISELLDIGSNGVAAYDERFLEKQPDWTFEDVDSGQSPVDRLTDRRADET